MSPINATTVAAWRDIAASLSAQRPSPGKIVRVTAGKRKGVEGTVLRHEVNRYDRSAWRYGGDASQHMTEMAGRRGYRVEVVAEGAVKGFWVDADKVEVIECFAATS